MNKCICTDILVNSVQDYKVKLIDLSGYLFSLTPFIPLPKDKNTTLICFTPQCTHHSLKITFSAPFSTGYF